MIPRSIGKKRFRKHGRVEGALAGRESVFSRLPDSQHAAPLLQGRLFLLLHNEEAGLYHLYLIQNSMTVRRSWNFISVVGVLNRK